MKVNTKQVKIIVVWILFMIGISVPNNIDTFLIALIKACISADLGLLAIYLLEY